MRHLLNRTAKFPLLGPWRPQLRAPRRLLAKAEPNTGMKAAQGSI